MFIKFQLCIVGILAIVASACSENKMLDKKIADASKDSDVPDVEQYLQTNATDEELELLNLTRSPIQPAIKDAVKSNNSQEDEITRKKQRLANTTKALEYLTAVLNLPSKGLKQAVAKCDRISEAIKFLNATTTPSRPFDGNRLRFKIALRKDRDNMLTVNGLSSCTKAKKLDKSLSDSAPAVAADEPVPTTDTDDSPSTGQ